MKKLILLAMSAMIIASCSERSENIDLSVENQVEYTADEKNDLICSYAQILATAVTDSDIRNIIKNEAQLQFDGDYDILTSKLQDIKLPYNGMTVKHKMAETNVMTRSSEGFNGNLVDLLNEIQTTFPNLQVSVPVHCDDWDTENFIPLVAFKPDYFTDSYPDTIEAFDSEGNIHVLSRKEEPDFPVIVISESERIRPDGTSVFDDECSEEFVENLISTKATLSTPTGFYLKHSSARSLDLYWNAVVSNGYYEIQRRVLNQGSFSTVGTVDGDENFYKNSGLTAGTKYEYRIRLINGSDQSAYTGAVTSTASERSVGEPLKLVWYKLDSGFMNKVESWDSGRPELRVVIYYGLNSSGGGNVRVFDQILSPTRNHIKDGCNPNLTIFGNWDPYNQGAIVSILWTEEDGTNEAGAESKVINVMYENQQNYGTPSIGVQVTHTMSNSYYHLGQLEANWWDPYSTIYNKIGSGSSIFEFQFGK